jgi:acyl carrier protein
VQTIEQQIRTFVRDTFLIGQDDGSLTGDTSFLDQGMIDSTGVLELVSFMEDTFGFQIADDELVPENLDSVNRLIRFIERKLTAVENAA